MAHELLEVSDVAPGLKHATGIGVAQGLRAEVIAKSGGCQGALEGGLHSTLVNGRPAPRREQPLIAGAPCGHALLSERRDDSESDLWLGPLGVIIARGKVVASELDRGPERRAKKSAGHP